MGLDKFENEELIKYGFVEDILVVCQETSSLDVPCLLPGIIFSLS